MSPISWQFDAFFVDPLNRELFRHGRRKALPPLAFDLLVYLLENNGRLVTKKDFERYVWNGQNILDGTLRIHIGEIRNVIGSKYVRTIRGKGYRLETDIRRIESDTTANTYARARTSAFGVEAFPALSPNGDRIVYNWNSVREDLFSLYVIPFKQGAPSRLTHVEAHDFSPIWSHDGRYIFFLRRSPINTALYRISAQSGTEEKVADVYQAAGIDVIGRQIDSSPDGEQLAFVDKCSSGEPLRIFSLSPSQQHSIKTPLTSPPADAFGDTDPAFSPSGGMMAFVRTSSVGMKALYLLNFGDNTVHLLTGGHTYIGGLTWTPDSNEIVFSSSKSGVLRLWRIRARGGDPQMVGTFGENGMYPHVSRTNSRLVYTRVFFSTNIWRFALTGTSTPNGRQNERFSSFFANDIPGQYSLDGESILFASDRSGYFEVWVSDSDGQKSRPL